MMKQNLNIKELNSHSITAILEPHLDSLYSMTSTIALCNEVSKLLKENKIDTPASRRLVLKLNQSRSITNSQFILTNSILAGNGMAVVR